MRIVLARSRSHHRGNGRGGNCGPHALLRGVPLCGLMNNRLNAGVPNIDLVESRPRAFQFVIGKTGAVKCLYGRVLQLPHLLWVALWGIVAFA